MNSESYEYWITVNGCVEHECHVNVDDEGNHVRVREQLETIGKLEAQPYTGTSYLVELFELHHSHGVWANSYSDELYVDAYEGFGGECECAQYAQDHRPIAEWVGA